MLPLSYILIPESRTLHLLHKPHFPHFNEGTHSLPQARVRVIQNVLSSSPRHPHHHRNRSTLILHLALTPPTTATTLIQLPVIPSPAAASPAHSSVLHTSAKQPLKQAWILQQLPITLRIKPKTYLGPEYPTCP